MRLEAGIVARLDGMMAACALDSASIFFCDRRRPEARVRYLQHRGVSDEAQYSYRHDGVFDEDPFGRLGEAGGPAGAMIRWSDRRLEAAPAARYRDFLARHRVGVVGAHVQALVPGLTLILGVHRRDVARRSAELSDRLLERECDGIARMVVAQLVGATLASDDGSRLVDAVLDPAPVATGAPAPDPRLSPREQEIADLICAGKQNKQVAHLFGLSQFTVENHLRRIYRKLGVHNRAALVNALLRPEAVTRIRH